MNHSFRYCQYLIHFYILVILISDAILVLNDVEKEDKKESDRSSIEIVVKSLTGRILNFDVMRDVDIDHVKQLIENENGVPPDQQRLVFNGKQLESGCSLSECNIQNGSILHLVLRLRGGLVPAIRC